MVRKRKTPSEGATKEEEGQHVVVEKKKRGRPPKKIPKLEHETESKSEDQQAQPVETKKKPQQERQAHPHHMHPVHPQPPAHPETHPQHAPAHAPHHHELNKVLERGHIYFFYRPKVGLKEAHSMKDVQRFYFILKPQTPKEGEGEGGKKGEEGKEVTEGGKKEKGKHPHIAKPKNRLLVVSKKKMPDISKKSKFWAFVEKASDKIEGLVHSKLEEEHYTTATRGERTVQAARPIGEGVYGIIEHGKQHHTHLAYVLELPQEVGTVQKEFNVVKEGSYIISVKNPEAPSPTFAGLGKEQKAHFPSHLQEKFEGRRFIPVNPPEFLDYEGAEFFLMGAKEDIREELEESGEIIEKQVEEEMGKEEEEIEKTGEPLDTKLYEELHMDKHKNPPLPLETGEFV